MGKDVRTKDSKGPRESKSDERESCSFVFCEDPVSGEIIAVPGKDCPEGFVKRIVSKAQESGIVFRLPQFKLEDFDDEEYKEFLEWKRKHKKQQEKEGEE
jgi:hypothetical protein